MKKFLKILLCLILTSVMFLIFLVTLAPIIGLILIGLSGEHILIEAFIDWFIIIVVIVGLFKLSAKILKLKD